MHQRPGHRSLMPGDVHRAARFAPAFLLLCGWLLVSSDAWAGSARLDLEIEPDDADVYLDGTYQGEVDKFDGHPDYLWVKPGRHRLEFRKRKYQSLRILFEAKADERKRFPQKLYKHREGEPKLVELNMLPAPSRPRSQVAFLKFLVEPADAALWIDGTLWGAAEQYDGNPEKAKVSSGTHKIELTRPGYRTHAAEIRLGPEQERTIRVTLDPQPQN
ncbi:MAG: PEGA domain-containing protein [bacterium]|nr:PEGA domain-containing protein [bacterium]